VLAPEKKGVGLAGMASATVDRMRGELGAGRDSKVCSSMPTAGGVDDSPVSDGCGGGQRRRKISTKSQSS
jgi:hypothetical protein